MLKNSEHPSELKTVKDTVWNVCLNSSVLLIIFLMGETPSCICKLIRLFHSQLAKDPSTVLQLSVYVISTDFTYK